LSLIPIGFSSAFDRHKISFINSYGIGVNMRGITAISNEGMPVPELIRASSGPEKIEKGAPVPSIIPVPIPARVPAAQPVTTLPASSPPAGGK
jgi:hypothetical protein